MTRPLAERFLLFVLFVSGGVLPSFAQCPAIEFDARSTTITDPSYVTGVARLQPGTFVGVRLQQQPPYTLLELLPHLERQFLSCYQRGTLGTAAPAFTDYSAGAGSMPVNIGRLNSGWTVGAISLGFGDVPEVNVVSAAAPFQIAANRRYTLPGNAISGNFVDVNHDGFADLIVVHSNQQTNAGGVSVFLGNGDGTFQDPVSYPAGSFAGSVSAGDFNGDGHVDLAVASAGSANILLLAGTGDGTFGAASIAATLPSGVNLLSLTAADLNGDGRLDLVAVTYSGLYIFTGNGAGSFTSGPLIALSEPPSYAAVGDFNLDGKPDLAIASPSAYVVSVLLGNGDGTFNPEVRYLGPNRPSFLVVTDINGDGKPDLAVAQGSPSLFAADDGSGAVTTLLGNGDGTFQGSQIYAAGANPVRVVSSDLNRDGKPDLLVVNGFLSGNASAPTSSFETFLNQGGGRFSAAVRSTNPTLGLSLAAADFNGDGRPDVAVAGGAVAVLWGNGDGTFAAGTTIGGITTGAVVAPGDFNGDGKPDLVIASNTSGFLAFLSGTPGVTVALNNGGGAFAPAVSLSTINAVALATGDFNGDGKLDIAALDGGPPFQPGGVVVFLGNGDGTFRATTEIPVEVAPSNIAVGDLNGDGLPDLAISTGGGASRSDSGYDVAVLLGNGDGSFKTPLFLPTAFGPAGLAISDLNGDGKADLIVMHCCGNTNPAYRLGNGDGTFQDELGFIGGASPLDVVAADLNGDGKLDLALADSAAGLAVLINHTAPAGFTSVLAGGFVDSPIAPGSIVSGFGVGVATGSASATALPLPTQLAGAAISVKDAAGITAAAPLFFASPFQLNYLLPEGTALGTAQLSVPSSSGTVTEMVQVVPFAPSLFVLNTANLIAGYLTRVAAGKTTIEPVYQLGDTGVVAAPIALPSAAADQLVLTIFGTGLRDYQGTFYAILGNQFVPVTYAGPQGADVGLDQVNIQLPSTLPAGNLPLAVGTFTGGFSNTAFLLIQ